MAVLVLLVWASVAYCPLIEGSSNRLAQIEKLLRGEFTHAYPQDGVIATFTKRQSKPIQTALGEQLSLLSDSSVRGTSTIHYTDAPVDPGQTEGNGFLRIHYHLTDVCDPPFVGIYANLSNPPKTFDLSGFKGVEITCRWGADDDGEQSAFFALCERNASEDEEYAWAEHQIPVTRSADGGFQKHRLMFAGFHTPFWRGLGELGIKFDTTQVFRFIIKIQARSKRDCGGILEIDDIRFF